MSLDFETDLQIGDDEWGIGFMKDPYNTQGLRNLDLDNIELQVTYIIPAVMPDPPTNLVATDGLPIGLTWTAPSNFGSDVDGNAVTSLDGYKVARTTSANSMLELP
ncbi:MAG: hypothetical protein HN625_06950, partial [Flavobacteriaceae bacterium]|nr:hypothetical protein [Flavobacteriaceae bacterium]